MYRKKCTNIVFTKNNWTQNLKELGFAGARLSFTLSRSTVIQKNCTKKTSQILYNIFVVQQKLYIFFCTNKWTTCFLCKHLFVQKKTCTQNKISKKCTKKNVQKNLYKHFFVQKTIGLKILRSWDSLVSDGRSLFPDPL